jgi:hypothetical protein
MAEEMLQIGIVEAGGEARRRRPQGVGNDDIEHLRQNDTEVVGLFLDEVVGLGCEQHG